jgi:hypothetical protein
VTRDYPATSAVYPATDYVTGAVHSITAPTQPSASGLAFRKYFLLWVNRCIQVPGVTPSLNACRNPRTKGNGYRGMIDDGAGDKVRPAFSTYAKADACTLIQAARVLGQTGGLDAAATAAGLRLWDGDDRVGLAPLARRFAMPNGQVMTYFVDTCILEAAPEAPDASGIVLDYEVWDNRTPAQTIDIVRNLAQLTHRRGKKLILITDPVPKPPSGLTAESVPEVISELDGFGSAIATGFSLGNPSTHYPARARMRSPWEAYQTQLSVVTDGGRNPLTPQLRRKLIWNIDLNDIALAEGRQLHEEIVRQGYRGVLLARNFQREGGTCDRPVNQTIACLALGQCDGRFGLGRH